MLPRISRRSIFLLCLDALAIPLSFLLANTLRTGYFSIQDLRQPIVGLALLTYLAALYIFDFYYPYKYFKIAQTAIETLYVVSSASLVLFAVSYLDRTFLTNRSIQFLFSLILTAAIFFIRIFYDAFFRSRFLDRRTLIIGTGPFAREVEHIIQNTPHAGIQAVGFVSEGETYETQPHRNMHIVGSVSRILTLVNWHNANLVVLAMESDIRKASEPSIIYTLMKNKVDVVSGIHLFEKLDEAIPFHVLDDHYFLNLMSEIRTHNYLKVKRLVDIIFSLILLVVLSPVFLLAAGLLATQGRDNIFFIQKRVGKDRKEFNMIKLKSMKESRDGKFRITNFGRWMRKYRIDEMPQLINVLKGEMSLIGPRPEISYFVEKCDEISPFYDVIFTLKPGLTGWAQVKFYHVTDLRDYKRKFQYNLYYLKNLSLTLDLLILFKTIGIVLAGKGK